MYQPLLLASMGNNRREHLFVFICLSILAGCGTEGAHPIPLRKVSEIKELAAQKSAQTVRFQGVVTLIDPVFGSFVVQDATAGIRIRPAAFMDVAMLGHRVEVGGQTTGGEEAESVINASVRDLGPAPWPDPRRLLPGDLKSERFDDLFVSVAGVIHSFQAGSTGDTSFPLYVGDMQITGRTVAALAPAGDQYEDAEVTAAGVASATVDLDGNVTGFTLLIPSLSLIKVVTPPVGPETMPVRSIAEVLALRVPPRHRLRLRGTVQSVANSPDLLFKDATGRIALQPAAQADFSNRKHGASAPIEIAAFVDREDSTSVLLDAFAFDAPDISASRRRHGTLTKAAEVLGLSPAEASLRLPVSLDAVVTYYNPKLFALFVEDSSGVFLATNRHPLSLRAGDHVLVSGVTGPGGFSPIVEGLKLRVIGRSPLPEPKRFTPEEISLGRADSQWVELDGVVQSIGSHYGTAFAMLASGPHRIRLTFSASDAVPTSLLDAHIRVRAVCGTIFNARRQALGIELYVPTLNQIQVIQRAPATLFATLVRPIVKLLSFTPTEPLGRRVHLRGSVTAAGVSGPTWIQDATGAVCIRTHNRLDLSPGDVVDVAGFPALGAFSPEIHDAIIRKLTSGPPPKPVVISPQQALSGDYDGRLVSIQGRLLNQFRDGHEQVLHMQAARSTFTARSGVNLDHFEDGSILGITGICTVSVKSSPVAVASPTFEVTLRSPPDAVLLRSAPWLTPHRTLRVFSLTALVVGLVLIWAWLLRRRVSLQTGVIAQKLKEVESLKAAAEAANHAKSNFLANMSHEIRTPMNGILGLTELALETDLNAEQRDSLVGVKSSANALLSIINDILDFSKIESGKLDLDPIEINLRDSLEESVRTMAMRADEKGLELVCSFAPDAPETVIADPTRLRQIMLNLLSNAIKFTKEGEVTLTLTVDSWDGDRVEVHVTVQDTGIGIAPGKQAVIFEAFSQEDVSTTRKYGGTGLGLTISARLVEMMGGKIWVESEEGVGSKFHFTCKLVAGKSAREASAMAQTASLAGIPVLVVVDNASSRSALSVLVESWGMKPTVTGGALEALEVLSAAAPDAFRVILCDAHMSGANGFSLASTWRRC